MRDLGYFPAPDNADAKDGFRVGLGTVATFADGHISGLKGERHVDFENGAYFCIRVQRATEMYWQCGYGRGL